MGFDDANVSQLWNMRLDEVEAGSEILFEPYVYTMIEDYLRVIKRVVHY